MKFTDLPIVPEILRAIEETGYEQPTPIQEWSIAHVINGRDVLGSAQTGTGKTAAFSIPTIQRLMANKPQGKSRAIRALVLTPTRELAIQIDESIATYGKYSGVRHAVIFGGVGQLAQTEQLRKGVDFLVATPGRLLDLMGQWFVDLRHLEVFILDEADRMLDMGFIHDVRKVLAVLPAKRQSLFFSATLPKEITELAGKILRDPVSVFVNPVSSSAETVDQRVYFVNRENKKPLLVHVLKDPAIRSALVFTRTKHGADKVVKDLVQNGVHAEAIHGNKSQNNRQRALSNFKSGEIRVLVATDIAARGIDISGLSHVINFEVPADSESYVHRIGRTGRAGATGSSITFCEANERQYLRSIEKLIGKSLPAVEDHPYTKDNDFASPVEVRGQRGGPGVGRNSWRAIQISERRPAREQEPKREPRAENGRAAGDTRNRRDDGQRPAGPARKPRPQNPANESPKTPTIGRTDRGRGNSETEKGPARPWKKKRRPPIRHGSKHD